MSEPFSITIDDRAVQRLLRKVAGKVQNMRPVFRELSGVLMDAVEENLEQEGRPAWPDLAPSTKEQRAKKGKWPGKILQVSQAGLASSITQKHDADSAAVGSNKRYAAIHEFGGQAGRGRKVTIPARPYLTPTDDDVRKMERVLVRYLEGA